MPDCWLATANPYVPSAPSESANRRCIPEAGRKIWHAAIKPNQEVYLLYVEDDFLACVLEALSSAFHSFTQSLAAAKSAVERSLGSLLGVNDASRRASLNNPRDAETKRRASRPVSIANELPGMQNPRAFSYLREQVKGQSFPAEPGPREKRTDHNPDLHYPHIAAFHFPVSGLLGNLSNPNPDVEEVPDAPPWDATDGTTQEFGLCHENGDDDLWSASNLLP